MAFFEGSSLRKAMSLYRVGKIACRKGQKIGGSLISLPLALRVLRQVSTPPKWYDTPPWYLVSHKHICAIPNSATYRAIIVRYPKKTSTEEFCDTIARSIARYEKYRCWASKERDARHHQCRGSDGCIDRCGQLPPSCCG